MQNVNNLKYLCLTKIKKKNKIKQKHMTILWDPALVEVPQEFASSDDSLQSLGVV